MRLAAFALMCLSAHSLSIAHAQISTQVLRIRCFIGRFARECSRPKYLEKSLWLRLKHLMRATLARVTAHPERMSVRRSLASA